MELAFSCRVAFHAAFSIDAVESSRNNTSSELILAAQQQMIWQKNR